MQDLALYRKYRPETFSDVIGQDHIISGLEKALKNQNVAHAYLLTGTRGIGKTTIARIIARELGTNPHDIYEIDAASNRGIDDIRELKENVRTLPFDSKYKVYIIDEVHMLTKEAFNALLKTLEEPPEHVVFILATTELEKVPETVCSRCQTHVFRKPTESILARQVERVAKLEGFTIDPAGAELIALLGDGSFRDTLGVLQKVLGGATGKIIDADAVAKATGAPRITLVNTIIASIAESDMSKALASIRQAYDEHADMAVFFRLLLSRFRLALILRYAPEESEAISTQASEADIDFLKTLVKGKPKTITSASLLHLLSAYEQQKHAPIQTLPLELAVMKILE